MTDFPSRLKALRIRRGLSQQALSDLVTVSKSSINMYERGEREPGIDQLEEFADFFNVDMDYLCGKSDTPNRLIADCDEKMLSFIEAWSLLTPDERNAVRKFLSLI